MRKSFGDGLFAAMFRQLDVHGGALPGDTLDLQASAVGIDDALADSQPKSAASIRPCPGRVHPIETLGHMGQMLGLNSLARVCDSGDSSVAGLSNGDSDRLTLGCVPNRVFDDVQHRPLE